VHADTLKRIGRPLPAKQSNTVPDGGAPGPELGPAPQGSTCDYYQESDTRQDPRVMRSCYRYDLVIEKSAYDLVPAFSAAMPPLRSAFGAPVRPGRSAADS